MYDALSRFPIVKDTVSIFAQSWKKIISSYERILDLNIILIQKDLDDFPSSHRYRRRRFMAAAPVCLTIAAGVEEVLLSCDLFFLLHLFSPASEVWFIVNKTF